MKCDFHIHTSFSSDSSLSPKRLVEICLEKQIDCICVTDHNEIKGALQTLHFAFDKPLLVICGMEVKTERGDILLLNLKKKIKNFSSFEELIKKARKEKAFVVLPHPFAFPIAFRNPKEVVEKGLIDAIEVENASSYSLANKMAKKLCQKFDFPFTAGSDAHHEIMVGKAYLEIEGENLKKEEIFERIKKRKAKIKKEKISLFERGIEYSNRVFAKIRHFFEKESISFLPRPKV